MSLLSNKAISQSSRVQTCVNLPEQKSPNYGHEQAARLITVTNTIMHKWFEFQMLERELSPTTGSNTISCFSRWHFNTALYFLSVIKVSTDYTDQYRILPQTAQTLTIITQQMLLQQRYSLSHQKHLSSTATSHNLEA